LIGWILYHHFHKRLIPLTSTLFPYTTLFRSIFPVNYAIEHSALVIRTGEGTKVDAIRAHPRVAFEIDGVDTEDGTAFSVVVKGNAKEINAPEDLQETLSLDVAPLQSGTKNHFIRILAEEVTGRRFPVTDPSDWETDLSH